MGENKRKIREKSADNKYTVILRGTSRIEFRTGTSDKPRILGTRNNKVEGNTDSEGRACGEKLKQRGPSYVSTVLRPAMGSSPHRTLADRTAPEVDDHE